MRTDPLRSSLIAGVIAAVIWIVISWATGGSAATVLLGGLIFLVGTALVTNVISILTAKSKSGGTRV